MLLIAKQPARALPLLEKAVAAAPGWPVPRVNLAWAKLQTGDKAGACALVLSIDPGRNEALAADLAKLKSLCEV